MEAILALLIVVAVFAAAIGGGIGIGRYLLPIRGGQFIAILIAMAGFGYAFYQTSNLEQVPAADVGTHGILIVYGMMLWMIFSMSMMLGNRINTGKIEMEKKLATWKEQLTRDTAFGKPLAIANTLCEIGALERNLGRHDLALSAYSQAAGIYGDELGVSDHPTMRTFWYTYAEVLRKNGRANDADSVISRFN